MQKETLTEAEIIAALNLALEASLIFAFDLSRTGIKTRQLRTPKQFKVNILVEALKEVENLSEQNKQAIVESFIHGQQFNQD